MAITHDVRARATGGDEWTTLATGLGESCPASLFLGLEPGTYEWAVQGYDGEADTRSDWSASRTVVVAEPAAVDTVYDLSIQATELDPDTDPWEEIVAGRVSRTITGAELLAAAGDAVASGGSYRWRVVGRDVDSGEESPPAEWRTFEVAGSGSDDDPRHVVYGPVRLAEGVGRISAETGTTAPIQSTSAVTAAITAGPALSGPVRAYSEGTSVAVLHPYNDHVVKVGPLSIIVAGVELPAPGVGLTLSAFVADTDDLINATAIGDLTIALEETDPGVSGQYDGTFQGAGLAADATLAAAESGTPFYVHLKDSTGSYHECYEVPWERTRLAEVV